MSVEGSSLTARERQVLALAAVGKTATEIAGALGITERTVQEHIDMVVRKLGADSTANAVAIFLKSGLVRE
jgi:DNA-binding CsgD family transcriptional regulator